MTLIKYKRNPRRAQSVMEYALLLGIAIAALVAGTKFLEHLLSDNPGHAGSFYNHFNIVRSYIDVAN